MLLGFNKDVCVCEMDLVNFTKWCCTKKETKTSTAKKDKQTDNTDEPQTIKISIIKNLTLNGVKLVKDMVLDVSSADAGKLVAENKARIVE